MKKYFVFLFLLFCTIFTACGNVEIDSLTEIKSNGRVMVKGTVKYDNTISLGVNDSIFKREMGLNPNLKLNRYVKENVNVEEIVFNYNDIHDLTKDKELYKLFIYTITKETGFFKDKYTIDMKFNVDTINNLIDSNKEYESYIKTIPINNTITVTGNVLDTNANNRISSNTIQWNYKLGDITKNTDMRVTFAEDVFLGPIVVVLGVATLIILIFIVVKKNKIKK